MKNNSLVICIKGFPGIIEENEIYTVKQVGNKGISLEEAYPPEPYTSFDKKRFKEIQSPDELEKILDSIQILELCS